MQIKQTGMSMPFMMWEFIVSLDEYKGLFYRYSKEKIEDHDRCYYCQICKSYFDDKHNLCNCVVGDAELPNILAGILKVKDD